MFITNNADTGRRRLMGSPKLQIIFHKRATKYRSLLRKMTCKDKGSYASSPPCKDVYETSLSSCKRKAKRKKGIQYACKNTNEKHKGRKGMRSHTCVLMMLAHKSTHSRARTHGHTPESSWRVFCFLARDSRQLSAKPEPPSDAALAGCSARSGCAMLPRLSPLSDAPLGCACVAACCSVLQCVAVCCSVLRCVAVCCNELHYGAVCCSAFLPRLSPPSDAPLGCACVAVCCCMLQCVAVCCSVLQCAAVCCSVSQCVAVCCSESQCAAMCCSVLQCVAVCCSVLQPVAAPHPSDAPLGCACVEGVRGGKEGAQ